MELNLELPDDIQLTPDQQRYLYCMMAQTAFIGGLGSGKTLIGCIKSIILSFFHPRSSGIIVAPTYSMLKSTILVTLEQLFDDMGLTDYVERKVSDMEIHMPNGSLIYLRSGDNPTRLRGPNLTWGLIDEATLLRDFPNVFVSVTSRLRDARRTRRDPVTGRPLFNLGVTGSPEGTLDAVYDTFFRAPEDPKKRKRWFDTVYTVQASTRDNPGADISYIEQMEMNIPEPLQDALIGGQWIEVGRGRCHFNFSKDRHVIGSDLKKIYNPRLPLRVTWDFNLDPMTCLVGQIAKLRNDRGRERRRLRMIDEFSLSHSNTPETCRAFIDRFGMRGLNHRGKIFIYGDSHGDKGTAEKTDYDTIREMFESHFPGQVIMKVPNSNPTHKTRVLASNTLFGNAAGISNAEISSRCRALIVDLDHQRWDKKKPSSKDKAQTLGGVSLGHCADAWEYIVNKEFPYRRPARPSNPTLDALTDRRWGGLPEVEPVG